MTQGDLNQEWARTQLEAWADGSLSSESRARMEAAIAADSRLKAAAERAVAVHRALRASSWSPPMPRGLRRRLLAIPRASSARRSFALPAFASAVTAVAVVAVAVWLTSEPPVQLDERSAAAQEAAREAAQEMEIAMRYLQKSARVTQGHVTSAVGLGLRDAFEASRAALAQKNPDETGG